MVSETAADLSDAVMAVENELHLLEIQWFCVKPAVEACEKAIDLSRMLNSLLKDKERYASNSN